MIELTNEGAVQLYGYAKGAGHVMIRLSVGMVAGCGSKLDMSRVSPLNSVESSMCKRCSKWLATDGGINDLAVAREHLAKSPSVADMIMSEPGAVLITTEGVSVVTEAGEVKIPDMRGTKGKEKRERPTRAHKNLSERQPEHVATGKVQGDTRAAERRRDAEAYVPGSEYETVVTAVTGSGAEVSAKIVRKTPVEFPGTDAAERAGARGHGMLDGVATLPRGATGTAGVRFDREITGPAAVEVPERGKYTRTQRRNWQRKQAAIRAAIARAAA